jgi:ferredoxin, 2Fe-2S
MSGSQSAGSQSAATSTVRVHPAGADLEVGVDEAIFWAARRMGWRWPSVCQGLGECGQCWVIVESGGENLQPATAAERALLGLGIVAGDPDARLACLTRVTGPAVVRRRGARPAEREQR